MKKKLIDREEGRRVDEWIKEKKIEMRFPIKEIRPSSNTEKDAHGNFTTRGHWAQYYDRGSF